MRGGGRGERGSGGPGGGWVGSVVGRVGGTSAGGEGPVRSGQPCSRRCAVPVQTSEQYAAYS